MPDLFTLSYFILWILVISLTVSVLYLLRQRPAASLVSPEPTASPGMPPGRNLPGLAPHSPFPLLDVTTITGEQVSLRHSLVFFSVTGCGVCKLLYPVLEKFRAHHPDIRLFILLFEEREGEMETILSEYKVTLPVIPYGMQDMPLFGTTVFPFAYAIDDQGLVVGKGHVNEEAHLVGLAEPLQGTSKPLSPTG